MKSIGKLSQSVLSTRKLTAKFQCIKESFSTIKSFDEIPGPKSYPMVGTLHNYLPWIGKYQFDALHRNGLKKFTEFGPVVREEIIPGTNIVWIFKPEDVQELLRKEGRCPRRRSHLALEQYRRTKPEIYNTGGLLPTNGTEWANLRSAFQKGLSSPHTVRKYLPLVNEVVDEFVHFINSGKMKPGDFLPSLSRVFLEMLALVAFDCRLNSFSDEELKPDSRSSKLMEAALTVNSCILKTDNGIQLWRHFETPIYRKLKKAHRYLDSVAVNLIKEKKQNMVENAEKMQSILEIYLSATDIDLKDLLGMSADMLLAGIDTTTYSTSFALYHLAKNVDKQKILREEATSLLPEPETEVTPDVLKKSHYLKAVVKESFRLNPISVGIGRILAEDATFSGYHVPKGNVVVTQNQVTCRLPEFFREPDAFVPERWLKCNKNETINPYLVLPFGHGPRTCIARRLAEQNIQTLLIKLCHNFTIEWEGKELDSKSYLINKPDRPLLFKFTQRRRNPK